SLARGPEADDRIEEGGLPRVVLGDVEDRKIVRREREHHRKRGNHDETEPDAGRDARRCERPRVPPPRRVDRRARAPEGEEEGRAEGRRAEIGSAHGAVRWTGVAPAFGAV